MNCPVCGRGGRKVGRVTLDRHVPATRREEFGDAAGFCPDPGCAVVYFGKTATLLKGEALFPVTQKEPGDAVPVCYCFGFTRGDIRQELSERGRADIPDRIKAGIDQGRCACKRMNPQGACCLGNVATAVKALRGGGGL